ncbi:MAG: sigma 54-interacting transcriptional regulator [Candidatus Babeliales bacterium]
MARYTFLPNIDYKPVILLIRITWASNILMYQSLALFLESFTQRIKRISYHQMVACLISLFFFLSPLVIAIFYFDPSYRPDFEFTIYTHESIFALLILMPLSLLYGLKQLQKNKSHKILKTQLTYVIIFFIFHVLINIYHTFPLAIYGITDGISILATICSNIFLTVALYYCLKKIIRLRFLNMHNHVHHASDTFNCADHLKTILESLGSATTSHEVTLLTQRFFGQAFNIPYANVKLAIRSFESNIATDYKNTDGNEFNSNQLEHFLNEKNIESSLTMNDYLKREKILIYDEVEYDDFYETQTSHQIALGFLDTIQADIFLPIYEEQKIIGSITIERHARGKQLYSDRERDEMIVFASFLSKIINLLQNRNLHELLKQRKTIIEELYLKHQEINQYKESIRSFLNNSHRAIGIIFYKNNRFIMANQDASQLLEVDPNQHKGDTVTKTLHHIAQQTLLYKTHQTQVVKTFSGKQIVISGVPEIEHHQVIITLYYPEIYDSIKKQIDSLKDPSDWDYLLYLETTKSGKLINQLIPGNGQILLNFKVNLLKLALGKKALLLDLPEDDLIPLVELLHIISLRETLHVLELNSQISCADTCMKLFGINPLYGCLNDAALLEKLNRKGTLLIKNIEHLDLDAQNNLAQFIRYGFYTIFKSDKRVQSDVRIICSTNQDLSYMVQQGKFSNVLFNELKKESLSMPSLLTLPEIEMEELIEGFTHQTLTAQEFKNLIKLSDNEKQYLAAQAPISLKELKERIQQLLINKSKKTGIYQEIQFESAYHLTDPQLIEAARLGKHALKDSKLLNVLWKKFKSQNKIALFLGVNRSSVNRRFKEHGLNFYETAE